MGEKTCDLYLHTDYLCEIKKIEFIKFLYSAACV
jgi:hypothetical protein